MTISYPYGMYEEAVLVGIDIMTPDGRKTVAAKITYHRGYAYNRPKHKDTIQVESINSEFSTIFLPAEAIRKLLEIADRPDLPTQPVDEL